MTLQKGEVRRQWSLEAFLKTSDDMLISFDASPWGLGAVLYIGGVPVSFFASVLSSADEKRYKVVIGDHKAQHLWESLTILVACELGVSIGLPARCR